MGKFIKVPSLPEAVGILFVVAVGALAWRVVVPASVKAKLPGA